MSDQTPLSRARGERERLAHVEAEMKRHAQEAREARKHYVYRCYDKADRLLYVGCTEDVFGRLAVHASSWNNPASAVLNLRMTRHSVTEYPGFTVARKAEREAIRDEAPLLNLHHQKVKRTPAERNQIIDDYLTATHPAPDAAAVAEFLADAS